jgi:hypothetical protein
MSWELSRICSLWIFHESFMNGHEGFTNVSWSVQECSGIELLSMVYDGLYDWLEKRSWIVHSDKIMVTINSWFIIGFKKVSWTDIFYDCSSGNNGYNSCSVHKLCENNHALNLNGLGWFMNGYDCFMIIMKYSKIVMND